MKTIQPTISKSTVEVYKLRKCKHDNWADITLDGEGSHVRISIASGYGNWSFFWGACGEDYRQFLISLDIYYTAGKFGESGWFDLEGTLAGYREDIVEARRNDELEADEARELWEAIDEMNDYDTESSFTAAMWNSKLMKYYEGTPYMKTSVSPSFRGFWENIWPVFVDQLKTELTATAQVA